LDQFAAVILSVLDKHIYWLIRGPEISALLVTDLPRLPKVRELIHNNLASLQTLRATLSQKVWRYSLLCFLP
jgi:hypothetical protein